MTNYQPLEYLDRLKDGTHLILLYDKPQYRDMVEYRFIRNGLTKKEHCIYLTNKKTEWIEDQMKIGGIDVVGNKQKNLLHIHQVENIVDHLKDVPEQLEELMQKVESGLKPPYRLIGRMIPSIDTKKGIEDELELEHILHTNFDKYKCSFLCTYNLDEIEQSNRKFWLNRLFEKHHAVIYATEPQKAVAFDTALV